jgi:hypothetical protein
MSARHFENNSECYCKVEHPGRGAPPYFVFTCGLKKADARITGLIVIAFAFNRHKGA